MTRQEGPTDHLKHGELTRAIIGCAFEVINELGSGFLESVYEKSMLRALSDNGLSVQAQFPIKVTFRNECVGEYFADMLVEEKVIVELKAVRAITGEHEAQLINYLSATGVEVGLLLNFGNPKLQFKRLTRTHEPKHHDSKLY